MVGIVGTARGRDQRTRELVQRRRRNLSRRLAGTERTQLRAVRREARSAHGGAPQGSRRAEERARAMDVRLLGSDCARRSRPAVTALTWDRAVSTLPPSAFP